MATAALVDGIAALISKQPAKDRMMLKSSVAPIPGRAGLPADTAPLRNLFISGNDKLLYELVRNYLRAVDRLFLVDSDAKSMLSRTVGIQALFDVLKRLAVQSFEAKDVSVAYFEARLVEAKTIDFANSYFQASGIGRSRIRKCIEVAIGHRLPEDLDPEGLALLQRAAG